MQSERGRTTEATRMMRIAFNDFSAKSFYEPGDIVGNAAVFKGKQKTVPLMTTEKVGMLMHRSMLDQTKATVIYEGPVEAPIRENQQIGLLRVEVEGGQVKEFPLYAGQAINELGVLGKIGMGAKMLLAKPEAPAEAQ